MINFPHIVKLSKDIESSPVTQVADVEVKSKSSQESDPGIFKHIGKLRRRVPNAIISMIEQTKTRPGDANNLRITCMARFS